MAFTLKPREPVAAGLKRVVLDEIRSASKKLAQDGAAKQDETIHETRKSVKKIRGVLRAARPALGKVYSAENRHFQKLGRSLAAFRDAAALLEVFDQLCERYSKELDSESLKAIRRGLELDKQKLENGSGAAQLVERAAETLNAAATRLDSWPLELVGLDDLAPGLKKTYRQGRRALKSARKRASPESFHDFRKRVKDRWYQVRLLEELDPSQAQHSESDLKQLGAWLGDDHNLAVLHDRLLGNPKRYGGARISRSLFPFIAREQKDLRNQALSTGHKLFAAKPSAYAAQLAASWQETAIKKPAAKQTTNNSRSRKAAG